MLILDPPARDPPVWGPFGEGPPEELIFTTLSKFHDTFIHVLQSDHSLCFSLIALNKHLILHNFLLILDPLPETPVWGPLWRGFQRSSFSLLYQNFMMHSYMYFNPIIPFASHSLHWTNISFFTIFFAHFLDPLPETLFGPPLERESHRSSFFSLLLKKISWCIHTFLSIV